MNRAIKYRIEPSAEQQVFFAKTFGCCRKVWNLMLADKQTSYTENGSFGKQTPAMYKKDYPYLKEVDSLALANVQMHLEQAMRNCFDPKRKARNGFPKFKSRRYSKKTYTTNNQKGTVRFIDDKLIHLPKVGDVKVIIHRKPERDWTIKSVTISQDPIGHYYVSVLFEYEAVISQSNGTRSIGLDYKSDGLYCDSEGNVAAPPKYYRSSHDKLAKAQRRLSRKIGARKAETPSKRYQKQKVRVAKIHRHIANQRMDTLHKRSTEIANQYDIVCVESLNMRAMANKGFGNGKATLDNGYGMFLNMLAYKLEERGKQLVRVDKWYPSSQLCSCCGKRKPMPLHERIYRCDCGLEMDRDKNAALNIEKEGLRLIRISA